MNKKIIKVVATFLILASIENISLAITDGININDETLLSSNKNNNIATMFDSEYDVSSNIDDKDSELKQEITELTKKTTYLLLGEANGGKESSENYYKRHKEYLKLRYNPEIPKDENSLTGLDENSNEYKDDILSGISVPGIFNKLNELEVKYISYGKTKVSVIDDEKVISTITLPDVQMKEKDTKNPTKYNIIRTDLTMYYYYKKLNNEYKLLYLYGETNNDIEQSIEQIDEKNGSLTQNTEYNSNLEEIYDFSKAKAINESKLNEIYDRNKTNIVYLKAIYNTGIVTSANGFFISDGIIITTYNFVEKALMKAQNIIINDNSENVYELDGIITMSKENDIALLKIKNRKSDYIEINDQIKLEKEDAVISLNSKNGIGLTAYKGIITAMDNNIQTSLATTEEIQGSPIFDKDGNLVGMINSKIFNTSISFATKNDTLKQYYLKLSEKEFNDIKCVPFEELKEKYYTKYNDEKYFYNIPESKWNEYSKVENIEESIKMPLVKASYIDGIISLRYKNEISNYMDAMQVASEYRENLRSKGYEEKIISDSKIIYHNEKYQIVLMNEFDYLIVVMVKL